MMLVKYLKVCAKADTSVFSFREFFNMRLYFPVKSMYSESVLNLPYVFAKASINEKTTTYKKSLFIILNNNSP